MLTQQSETLRHIVIGLNEVLTEIYGVETRLSRLLANLDFDPTQIEKLRKAHLEQVVTGFIKRLQQRMLTFQDGERAYLIISCYYGLDGKPRKTLQTLGEELGISRERVRQLKEKALKKCKARGSRQFFEVTLQNDIKLLLDSSTA